MKKMLVFLLGSIAFVTVGLVVLGLLFDKDENQKQAGLTDVYDVSPHGDIAYVRYDKGSAQLFVKSDEQPLLELPVEQTIVDVTYSIDGKYLAFTVTNKDVEESEGTELHILQMDTLKDDMIFSVDGLITELAFDPKQPDVLFYLQADTYTNYSPVASKRPHAYDVHSYDLDKREYIKHTDMKKYEMTSLQVSATDHSVFVQMDDDDHVETAEDVFSTSQRIFEIPLDNPDKKSIISSPVQADDIYDFTILPEHQEIIYQAVAGTGESGIFEYELFIFNWKTYKTEQLTSLKEAASSPVFGPDGKIYFMLDRNFGGRTPDYHLYRISRDGKNVEEVQLDQSKS